MKLTLRTLLAFMDGTVTEDESAALRTKIKASAPIRELIQRIRKVVNNSELPAPRNDGLDSTGNPNNTSEYLDNLLDIEIVPNFEKLAIGSDVLLAEIAETHQILAALSELDTGISGTLRNRLYEQVETLYGKDEEDPDVFPVIEDHSSINEEYVDSPVKNKAQPDGFQLTPPPRKAEIKSRTNREQPASGSSSSLSGMKPGKSSGIELPQLNHSSPERPPTPAPPVIKKNEDGESRPMAEENQSPADEGDDSNSIPLPLINDQTQSKNQPAAKTTEDSPAAANRIGETTEDNHIRLLPVIMATACVTALICLVSVSYYYNGQGNTDSKKIAEGKQPDANPLDNLLDEDHKSQRVLKSGESIDSAKKEPGKSQLDQQKTPMETSPDTANIEDLPPVTVTPSSPAEATGKQNPSPSGNIINLVDNQSAEKKRPVNSDSKRSDKDLDAKQTKPTEIKNSVGPESDPILIGNGPKIGTFQSKNQPCFRKTNLPNADWLFLFENETVFINDTIAALPQCQPVIDILESIQMKLYGITFVTLHENPGKTLPKVELANGLVVFSNKKGPNTTIDISCGEMTFQTTFVDAKSNLTFLSLNSPIVGKTADGPLTSENETQLLVQITAENGRGILNYDGKVVTLEAGQMLVLGNKAHSVTEFKQRPVKLLKKKSTLTETSKELLCQIANQNRFAKDCFTKLSVDSRSYVRKFIVQAAWVLGDIKPMLAFLENPQNSAFWGELILFSRTTFLNNADFQQQQRERFSKFGNDAGKILKMIQINTDGELSSGGDRFLLESLGDEQLSVRVAAIWTLLAITGETKLFRPDDDPLKRKKSLKDWEKAFENDQIRFRVPIRPDVFQ